MATSGTNTFEGGTDGVAVTAAGSGGASGTAFDAIWSTGLTWKAAAALKGAMGGRVLAGAAGGGVFNLSGTKSAAKIYWRQSAATTGDLYLMRFDNSSNAKLVAIRVTGANKIRIEDAAGTTGIANFTTVLTTGTIYRLEAFVIAGTTSSNGTIKVAYYVGDSTTPVETAVFLNGTANVGAGATLGRVIGGSYGTSATCDTDFDNFGFDTTANDFIGIPAATPPTVSTPANQNVAAGATVSESVTASSTSGTISSYAWSFTYPTSGAPTLTGASTANASFTAGSVGTLYKLQCVVTDSNSLTTTVTTEVRVPTTGDALPLPGTATSSTGTWSNVGGASTPGDAIADSTDATYEEAGSLSATASVIRFRIQPMTSRSTLTSTERFEQDIAGTTTVKFRLYEGTTLIQEWTQTITTSWVDYPFSVTTPSSIGDWGNLYKEVYVTSP